MVWEQQDDLWPFIASIIYMAAWCFSFYGQIYENYKFKSVQGYSLDFLVFNITGYTFYTIYTSVGYFTKIPGAGTVVIADLIFVYHSMAMVFIQAIQCLIYKKGKNRIAGSSVIIVCILWSLVLIEIVLTWNGTIEQYEYWNPISVLGYAKLVLTLIKCTPAAYWNYKRKSTIGWSINSIIFDLIGGIFSMASGGLQLQNGLNITKFILGFISIAYDLLFCFQHYCLYRERSVSRSQEIVDKKNLIQKQGSDKYEHVKSDNIV